MSTEPVHAQSGRLEELTSKDTVEKVAKAIEKNEYTASGYHNIVFAMAIKEAGFDPYEILREAAEKLIEATRMETGEEPPVHEEVIVSWLAAWRERVHAPSDLLKIIVYLRLAVIRRMIRGEMWIDEVGENVIVITDGKTSYYIGDGWLKPK